MSQVKSLPARPNLLQLKKQAKERLALLRKTNPKAKLAEAQLALAREYGFGSWRAIQKQVTSSQLINATSAGDLELVRSLLDQGHDVEARDQFGNTALGWVRGKQMIEILKLLLDRGANPNAPGYNDHSPVALYAYESEPAAVKLLLEYGADPNQPRKLTGETALHLVMVKDRPGRLACARHLLEAGADPNRRAKVGVDSDRGSHVRVVGETPLHIASASGDRQMVKLLLDHGADATIRDANGNTPVSLNTKKTSKNKF